MHAPIAFLLGYTSNKINYSSVVDMFQFLHPSPVCNALWAEPSFGGVSDNNLITWGRSADVDAREEIKRLRLSNPEV